MSVARALVTLKRLNDRIYKCGENKFVATCVGQKPVTGFASNDEFKKEAKANLDQAFSLIERRNAIKTAIVASNAITNVVVNGKTMTVAEAIERKVSIEYEKSLLFILRDQYNDSQSVVEAYNKAIMEQLDKNLQAVYGKEGSQRVKEEDYQAIAKPFLEQREYKIIHPDNLLKLMKDLEESIEGFMTEVDSVLTEANARTDIEI